MRDLVYDELEDATGLARNTVQHCKWVSESIDSCNRLQELSWTHHLAVAALPEPEQVKLTGGKEKVKSFTFSDYCTSIGITRQTGRNAGKVLAEMPKATRQFDGKNEDGTVRRSKGATAETYADLKIDKHEASRWQGRCAMRTSG